MALNIPNPSFIEIEAALKAGGSPLEASEAHGIICGVICALPESTQSAWEGMIFAENTEGEHLEPLRELYRSSYQAMTSFSFEFHLLMPDDKANINLRTEALGYWCEGFLTGLNHSEKAIQDFASEEAMDALADLTEIAQVSAANLKKNNENENAYVELVEYIRFAVLMIYHEIKTASLNPFEDNNTLH
jgi:uncharacterized protein